MTQLTFETWPIERLTEYARNPRKNDHAVDKIAAAIKEFGFRVPVVAKSDGLVVDGHLRLKAAKKLGMAEVPVILADDMTEAQIKAFRISVNRMAEFAEWDNDLLALEFAELTDMGFDLDLTGFTADEIDALTPVQVDEGLTDDDAVPDVPVDPVTVRGDIWVLGNHRLMCGDSTTLSNVERLLESRKADMVFTDPPYGVAYEGGHNKKKRQGIIADTLEGEDLTNLFYGALMAAIPCTKDGAPFYVWYASGKSIETFASLAQLPLTLRAVIQWYKVKSGLGAFMAQYIPNCEPCMYLHKTGCSPAWYGPSNEKTVWELKKEPRNDFHPTQKPVELPERAIRNSSKQGDEILDLFGGSGSTLIACEKTGRHARLMELDPKYCDVIVKRWQDFTGKIATHAETGEPFAEVTNGNEKPQKAD
jgi:DNA modification methylase